ncbi:diaminobutyrate--2-oxoglutarate transaminase family protein [Wohlfahrtiimonas chitiniclastica]|uniref:diaminobutyrate--2-oxoglutarate transaminase family protein n=1 Tax=Wohlfahrtiimonas chitiniclastica TaxID=400946 RepID=UPI0007B41916|nr:diaminobutyrate--2-oxoglutarate transaminase family protein [Wohlfahrtiimonas chitiniclastica]KZS22731.1 diaminobutyrate--2-oxoglutarate aminotransferase [Wohlfahrtiimonas chitiniclastica]WHR55183.1 diaminobutyrate--2-oxoglutarate transaminase family protein [Wohlfahrtiimonas chitiniclastica]
MGTTPLSTFDNQYYIDRQSHFESNARSYPRKFPISIKKAQGAWLEDVEGKRYLDCLAGAGTLALGHNHPSIIQAIKDVLESELPLHTLDLTTPLKDQFSETVLSLLPGNSDDWRLQFCGPTGADANEAAFKLAKTVTGRASIISFTGGYHGMTNGTLSATGNLDAKTPISGLMPYVQFMPYPYAYRCPLGIGGEQGEVALANLFERMLTDIESGITKPAAVILEAIQGEGGVVPAPAHWLKRVREVTERLGIVLILDEVQAGIGRSGDFFAFGESGIVPDMIVMSKAIGGGLPMAVVAYRAELDVWNPGAHTGTFRGNQLAMATGLVTLEMITKQGVQENVQIAGKALKEGLLVLQKSHPCIGQVRGRGLMLGLEIVDANGQKDPLGSLPYAPELAMALQRACFDAGLIAERGGRHGCVLRFLPPLTLSLDEVALILERLDIALTQISQ